VPLALGSAYDQLVEQLGVRPLPEPLIEQALTHSSYVNESEGDSQSNERLEFLGDAVLGFVVAEYLYRKYPAAGEGELTRMRAEIVQGATLAAAARRLDLGSHLRLGKGAEAAGSRRAERQLSDAFEAVLGAVYVEQGYRAARSLVLRLLAPELKALRRRGAPYDPKSRLMHIVQAQWHEPPEYVTVEQDIDGSRRRFTVEVKAAGAPLGRGSGASKREAQQRAARQALAAISGEEMGG
jgi:ribonuclease-3